MKCRANNRSYRPLAVAFMAVAALVLGSAAPCSATTCNVIVGRSAFCDPGPDQGDFVINSRCGTGGSTVVKGQLYINGGLNSETVTITSLGNGPLDCPDGGTTETFTNRYEWSNASTTLPDGGYTLKTKAIFSSAPAVYSPQISDSISCP
jgi:hypothetical protein